jgi:Cytochrome P450
LDQLIRNPALIPDALEECFRLASNGYFTLPRIASRDTEVGGTPVLKDMVVRPSPLAPNYDPDVFPDPTLFVHSSQAKADTILRCGPASLHRQHPRPHYHHHRNPPPAGALS